MSRYQPKHDWQDHLPGETFEGKPLRDYLGWVDGNQAGRVRFDYYGPTKGLWQWSGGRPANWHGTPVMPNTGFVRSLSEAVRMCEEYYDKMQEVNRR